MHRLSKSDYLLGLQCPLALWFKHYRKDLDIETSEEKAERELHTDEGNEVGKWAKQYFEGGFEVTNLPNPSFSFEKAICQTKKARDEGQRIIFEAAAETSNGLFAQSDILRRNTDDTWDLIEVKSSKRLTEDKESKKDKDHYLDDIGFQYHVFSLAGYNIKRCYFMFLNEEYVRNGTIDPKKLLREELVTDKAIKASNKVASESGRLLGVLNSSSPPTQSIGSHCDKPYVCRYKGECWKDVPLYSIFNVLSKNKASELYKNGIVNVSDLPEQKWSKESKKPIEIEAFLKRKEHVDTEKIVKFLDKIQLPLYFLDYETIECAVPLFDKTSPKQQIPFQFSLHTQKKHGPEHCQTAYRG